MSKLRDKEVEKVSRREAVTRLMAAGLGMASLFRGRAANAQVGAPAVVTPPKDSNFPLPRGWDTELIKLRPNIFAYVQAGGIGIGSGAGVSNAGVIVGEDHLLLIDTLGEPMLVDALKSAIRNKIGNKPVGRVIDTHQHGDHVGGNQFFMPVEIVGHPFCRDTVAKMAAALPAGAKFERHEGWANGTEEKKLIVPSVTIADKQTYHYNKIAVEVSHPGVAHTWGDLMVYLPEHKILFAADIAVFKMTPWTHNGNVAQWMEVIDKIMAMDVEAIVPGHGPIGGKKELAEVREYFVLLQREARKRFDAGMSPGKAAADINFGKFENWIGAERNLLNTFRIYGEFDGSQTPVLDVQGMNQAADEYNAIIKERLART
jgi:glyoxylase-like metal-dependent hydrolase (beta-lactamase superfamily II)